MPIQPKLSLQAESELDFAGRDRLNEPSELNCRPHPLSSKCGGEGKERDDNKGYGLN